MLAAQAWAARLFTDLGPACRAQALAVWACPKGRLDLVCAWLTDQRTHNLVRARWPSLGRELRGTSPVSLASNVSALGLRNGREGLLGVLVYAGEWPDGAACTLLEALRSELMLALGPPLPPPSPDVLALPLDRLDAPGGTQVAERLVLRALLARHGGNIRRTAQAVGLGRQTLLDRANRLRVGDVTLRVTRALPQRPPLPNDALELERNACRMVLERCGGDLKLGAALLHMTPATWRTYLDRIGIDPPAPQRRRVHRRQA